MSVVNRGRPRGRVTSVLLALALFFAHLTAAHAASYGLVNPGFHWSGRCLLYGWTTHGLAATGTTSNNKCHAVITAQAPATGTQESTLYGSGIQQTFVVDPAAPVLRMFVKASSDRPGTIFPAQTITVRNQQGGVIYQQSRNAQQSDYENFLFELDLTAHAGQSVHLSFDVQIDTANPDSPTNVVLRIDDMPIIAGEGPEIPPGGGW